MEEIKNSPSRMDAPQEVEIQDFKQIQLNAETKSIFLPKGMQVDLGGISKGWIPEQAALQLVKACEACAVSAGGDMVLITLPVGETSWEIGLENPIEPDQDLTVLHVKPGAVATSSIAKRKWQHNGKLQHHFIDPRSGKPAMTEWLSTTVWAETAAQAEVYAKALLIAGPQATDGLFKNQTSKAYLAVDYHGWVHGSNNYHEV